MVNDYRTALLDELAARKSRNTAYSLRAFARDLGVSTTALSDVLAAKRHFSSANAARVADRLALPLVSPKKCAAPASFQRFDDDRFRLISDWYYFAILSLARIPRNRVEPEWVARRLGLSAIEARAALSRLFRMKLIEKKGKGFRRTGLPIATTSDLPSAALRTYHKQNLGLVEASIDRDPIERRSNSSVTMAIHPSRIAGAKKRIEKFRKGLSAYLETGRPTEVYTLAVHLYPASRGNS